MAIWTSGSAGLSAVCRNILRRWNARHRESRRRHLGASHAAVASWGDSEGHVACDSAPIGCSCASPKHIQSTFQGVAVPVFTTAKPLFDDRPMSTSIVRLTKVGLQTLRSLFQNQKDLALVCDARASAPINRAASPDGVPPPKPAPSRGGGILKANPCTPLQRD